MSSAPSTAARTTPAAGAPPAGARPGGPRAWTTPLVLAAFVAVLALAERRLLLDVFADAAPPAWRSLSLPLLAAGLAWLLLPPARWVALGVAGAVLSALLTLDRGALDFFLQPVNLGMLPALPQLWDARESTVALAGAADVTRTGAFLGVTAWGLLAWRRRRVRRDLPELRAAGGVPRRRERLAALAVVAAGAAPLAAVAASAPPAPASALEMHHPAVLVVREQGLWSYHLRDVLDALSAATSRTGPDPTETRLIAAALDESLQLNATPSPLFGIARGRDVLLVQLEAFQHFVLGLRTPSGPVTPVLDRLAAEGLSFDHCLDVTAVGRTSDAEFAVLTGLLPSRREVVALARAGQDWVTLPRVLAAHGYTSHTFHAYEPSFWNRAVAHPAYGIDELHFAASFAPGRTLGWGLDDAEAFAQTAARLAAAPRPWLALVISLTSHHPYSHVPAELADWDTGLPEPSMAADYLRLVHATDAALQGLLDGLAAAGRLEQTLLVVYGDHAAGLDAPSAGHVLAATGRDPSHPAERRVPLVIAVPGAEDRLAAHREAFRGTVGGMHDIAPTVLHLLGLDPAPGMTGVHLFVPPERRGVLPLPRGDGFVAANRVHATLDMRADDPPDVVARRDAWAHEAYRRLELNELIVVHDAQGTPPRAGELPLPALLARAFGEAAPAALPEWHVEREGLEPLPEGCWLVPAVPPAGRGHHLRLELRSTAPDPRRWYLRGHDASGMLVLERHGSVDPGATELLGLRAAPSDARGTLAYALLTISGGLAASTHVRDTLGSAPVPLLREAAARTEVRGRTDGLGGLAVVLVNPTRSPREVRLVARVGDESLADEQLRVAGRVSRSVTLELPGTPGELHLEVTGAPVAVAWVRWDEQGRLYR